MHTYIKQNAHNPHTLSHKFECARICKYLTYIQTERYYKYIDCMKGCSNIQTRVYYKYTDCTTGWSKIQTQVYYKYIDCTKGCLDIQTKVYCKYSYYTYRFTQTYCHSSIMYIDALLWIEKGKTLGAWPCANIPLCVLREKNGNKFSLRWVKAPWQGKIYWES